MSPQEQGRRVPKRVALAALAALGGGVLIGPPLLHSENTLRVLGVIVGKTAECATGIEAQKQPYPFDAIVVPGVGNDKTTDGNYTPNRDERMRLEAAALAFSQGLAPTIVLLDGLRNSQENGSVEKTYLQYAFGKLTGGGSESIDDEAIILGERSINTATGMDELAEIAKLRGMRRVLIVTNSYHEVRATLLACANGVAASPRSAERLLLGQKFQRYDSWTMIVIRLKEELEIIWAIWDPMGIAPTILKIMVLGLKG